jgi:hypothetical protein
MPTLPKPIELRPAQGGQLISVYSHDNVGAQNYVEKVNVRRQDDAEVNREGYVRFRPIENLPVEAQSSLPADINGQFEAVRPNGERAFIATSPEQIFKFRPNTGSWTVIGSGFSATGNRWQGVNLNGWLVLNNGVDLPVTYRVEDVAVQPMRELREVGVASVTHIEVDNAFLMLGGVRQILEDKLLEWLNGVAPYGPVPDNLTQYVSYLVMWSNPSDPTNYAVQISGSILSTESRNTVVMDWPSESLKIGDRVIVYGAGPLGGNLGGQPGIENGVPITNISGNILTLGALADPELVYPLPVSVLRWGDIASFSGSERLTDDSAPITAMKRLGRITVIYRGTKIWTARFTGDWQKPYAFRAGPETKHTPVSPHLIATVDASHVYATKDTFYQYDGLDTPQIFQPLHLNRKLFHNAGPATDLEPAGWCFDNEFTKEIWFVRPQMSLCYDYLTKTVSSIDEGYAAGGVIWRPGSEDKEYWVTLLRSGLVLRYGIGEHGPFEWRRLDNPMTCVVSGGLVKPSAATFGEIIVTSYIPTLGTGDPQMPFEVEILYADDASKPALPLFSHSMPDPLLENLIPMFYQHTYFRDRVRWTTETNEQIRLVSRLYELAPVNGKSVVRRQSPH